MVRIGIVGIGFMGFAHFEGARSIAGGQVTAIATRSEKKLAGDWTGIQGNFGPPAGQVDVSGLKRYSDYRDLINNPDVDLVDVCVPTDLHKQVVLEAIAAGKAVLVEKPIAVNLDDAREMAEAAQAAKVPLYVGHVLPMMPEFAYAADAIRSGDHGRLLGGHFRRIISPPDWSTEMADFRNLGGWGIDLHIHDTHFVAYACGRPRAVFSRGLLQDGFVNHVHSSYVFEEDGLAITSVSGGIAANGLQFGHAFELYFENGTLLFEAGTYGGEWTVDRPLTLARNDGSMTSVDLGEPAEWCAGFGMELETVCRAMTNGESPGPLDVQLAVDALEICYAEAKSIECGEIVELGS